MTVAPARSVLALDLVSALVDNRLGRMGDGRRRADACMIELAGATLELKVLRHLV